MKNMKIKGLKNLVGDFLGYGRCPVTNDTYWHADIVSVPYSESSGVLVSSRALSEVSKDEIARIVFYKSHEPGHYPRTSRYSLEQITEQIPGNCMRLPR